MIEQSRRTFLKIAGVAGAATLLGVGVEGWRDRAKKPKTDSIQILGVQTVKLGDAAPNEVITEKDYTFYNAVNSAGENITVKYKGSKGEANLAPGYYGIDYNQDKISEPLTWTILAISSISKDQYEAAKAEAMKVKPAGSVQLDR